MADHAALPNGVTSGLKGGSMREAGCARFVWPENGCAVGSGEVIAAMPPAAAPRDARTGGPGVALIYLRARGAPTE